ncbi:MAG TPA: hypothetical protein VMD09_04355 [Solirubrobacteraceae bacterium]|nr:hypothetical protein [Solirubrobacteraceae bacterium]
MLARIAITLAAAVGLGTLVTEASAASHARPAAQASAASLSLTVAPATVHPGNRYTITITGSYTKRAHHTPYLVAFIQYSARACKSTAPAEYGLPHGDWTFVVFPQAESKSPFKSVTYWKASKRLGYRRVCTYLYPGPVNTGTTAQPLAEAGAYGAAFQVDR